MVSCESLSAHLKSYLFRWRNQYYRICLHWLPPDRHFSQAIPAHPSIKWKFHLSCLNFSICVLFSRSMIFFLKVIKNKTPNREIQFPQSFFIITFSYQDGKAAIKSPVNKRNLVHVYSPSLHLLSLYHHNRISYLRLSD